MYIYICAFTSVCIHIYDYICTHMYLFDDLKGLGHYACGI